MKMLKKIFYIILGFLLASAVSLVGVILYAEYSGRRFWPDSGERIAQAGLPEEESRLAYDENGNIAELPGSSQPASAETETAISGSSDTGNTAGDTNTDTSAASPAGTDVSNASAFDADIPADSSSQEAASAEEPYTGSQIEQLYIMDMGSALFHTADCPYASNIAVDKRAERTTTSEKILNAGYQPCPNCNP